MVGLAYQRLSDLLLSLSDRRNPNPAEFTSAFLDSWSIVDSSHRLRRLITSMPGIKQNDPKILLFLQRTASIEELRNFIQHANGDIQELAENQKPFWGSLCWFRVYKPYEGRICILRAGSSHQKEENFPMVNPCGETVEPPLDLITLYAAGLEVNLTQVARAVAIVAGDIPQLLSARFNLVLPGAAADIFASADFTANAT